MFPLQLHLKDFMKHRESVIDCTSFNSALIIGMNKQDPRQSNGTGKSTVFKAINYVLFNVSPTKKLEKIVRDGAKKCSVQFDFQLSTGTYRVIRSRSRSGSADLWLKQKNGKAWKNISQKTNTETEAELHKLIKINYKAFQHSILFAQGDLDGIAAATPQERKALLKEPLQLSVYTKFEKLAKDKASEATTKLDSIKKSIIELGKPEEDIKAFEEQIITITRSIAADENLRGKAQIELDHKRSELSDYQRAISSEASSIRKNLDDVNKKIADETKTIGRLSKSIADKQLKLAEYKSGLDQRLKSYNKLKEDLEELDASEVRDEPDIQEDIERIAESEHRGRVHLARLEGELERYNKPLPESEQCPTCLQEISGEHRGACEREATEQKTKLQETLDDYKTKLKVVLDKKEKYVAELKKSAQHKFNVKSLKSTIENKKSEIKETQDRIVEFDSLITDAQKEKEVEQKSLDELKNRAAALKETLDNFSIDEINSKIDKIKIEISNLEAETNSLLQNISSSNTRLGIFEEKKRSRESDKLNLDALKSQKQTVEHNTLMLQKVAQAFSSSGIPTLIIHTILDDLQLEANNMLADLRPGISLKFSISKNDKDTLDLAFFIDGAEKDWEQLGGGQKVFISLSLRMALSIIIQRRLGVEIKFLELDEVDQPLDAAGVDAYAELIKKWQDNFKIFVVTHNDLLKDKFSHAILVESDDDGSTARVVTSW